MRLIRSTAPAGYAWSTSTTSNDAPPSCDDKSSRQSSSGSQRLWEGTITDSWSGIEQLRASERSPVAQQAGSTEPLACRVARNVVQVNLRSEERRVGKECRS